MAKKKLDNHYNDIKLIHVEMFEKRHQTPDYVQEHFFPDGKYAPLDRKVFRGIAFEKCSKWKAQGITGIILYRSGLFPAYDEILNACVENDLYLCPMLFSFLQGVWLPSHLSIFNNKGIPNTPSQEEIMLWNRESELMQKFDSVDSYKTYVRYAKTYTDLILEKEKQGDSLDLDAALASYKERLNLRYSAALEFIKVAIEDNTEFFTEFRTNWLANKFKYIPKPSLHIPKPYNKRRHK